MTFEEVSLSSFSSTVIPHFCDLQLILRVVILFSNDDAKIGKKELLIAEKVFFRHAEE